MSSDLKEGKTAQPYFEAIIETLNYNTAIYREELAKLTYSIDRLGYSPIDREDEKLVIKSAEPSVPTSKVDPTIIDRLKDLTDMVRYQNSMLTTLNNRLAQFA